MRVLVLLVALAGCDKVFSLHEVPDALPIDGPVVCPPGIGHDEDGDCVPDTTDVCPGIPDPAQLDGDGDGVGDACDPQPMTSGNKLDTFVSFELDAEQSSWTAQGGQWVVGSDDYTNLDMTAFPEDWSYRGGKMFGELNEIQARITTGALGADVKVGVAFYSPTGTPVEWSCSIRKPLGQTATLDAYANQSPAHTWPLTPSNTFGENTTYTFHARLDSGQITCAVQGDAGDSAQVNAPISGFAPGYVAVFTQAAVAHVHYLAVYTVK